jgi:hypothetical protein
VQDAAGLDQPERLPAVAAGEDGAGHG